LTKDVCSTLDAQSEQCVPELNLWCAELLLVASDMSVVFPGGRSADSRAS
jgi:hypothetical protein